MSKSELRKKGIIVRDSLSPLSVKEKSKNISVRLENIDCFINAKSVLFYYAHGSEVDTLMLIEKYADKKRIYLPKLVGENEFMALPFQGFDALKKNKYGIPEPLHGDSPDKIDVIIVPGVLFDKEGNRIGMGKGYYDRYLKYFPDTVKIGLAFVEQILDYIPKDKYDVPVDILVTDGD